MTAYKELKENIKEIGKDLRAAKKWANKTTEKLKKFNERDIFEEHDEVTKQLKELDKEVKFIGSRLADTLEMVVEHIEDIKFLFKACSQLLERIKKLEDKQAPEFFRKRLLGQRTTLEEAFKHQLQGSWPYNLSSYLKNLTEEKK